jgi:hypothetical protein
MKNILELAVLSRKNYFDASGIGIPEAYQHRHFSRPQRILRLMTMNQSGGAKAPPLQFQIRLIRSIR